MAANYIQPGDNITAVAPYDRTSGQGMLCGSLFCVALSAILNGAQGEAATKGVWSLAKATGEAWTFGAKIYWDNTNKRCTTTSAGNTLIGVAAAAAGELSAATVGAVRLGIVS